MKLDRNKEALNYVKKAMSIKPTKSLYNTLKNLETKLNGPEHSNSSLEENENSSNSTTLEKKTDYMKTNYKLEEIQNLKSNFTIFKILKIISEKLFSIVRKNKFLFTVLSFIILYYFKLHISSMFESILGYIKFR